MNVENILKVAQAIEDAAKPDARPKFGFNMAIYRGEAEQHGDQTGHRCGTVACIAGWAAPRARVLIEETAQRNLGLTTKQSEELFLGVGRPWWVGLEDIRPDHAVAVLRHLAATGVVDWTVGAPDVEYNDESESFDLSDDREALASAGIEEGE